MNDGILSEPIDLNARRHTKPTYRPVAAAMGVVIEHRASETVGAILSFKPQLVVIRDRFGRDHQITPRPGAFSINGEPITLIPPPAPSKDAGVVLTASGSISAGETPARMARASRIWVEGIHDAELIEKVWGHDLRYEGVVVEQLDGMDDLSDRVSRFRPDSRRRLGILLDHLVAGSKETREASQVNDPNVLIVGHPYVDVWQAVRPSVIGLDAWPTVPMGTDWKLGILKGIGFKGHPGVFWKQLLGRVESYKDLEQPLVHSVESMIDFVTRP